MRTITQTTTPPACLAAQPAGQSWKKFMQTPCHTLVADSLRNEQCHLCCYCEMEINETNSHIEHLVPRSQNAAKTYDYGNLAASCNGGTGSSRHCGHRKDNDYDQKLFVSPHSSTANSLFTYGLDGSIGPANTKSPETANYMCALLALNCPALKGRRREHARRLIKTLGKTPTPKLIAWAHTYYLQPDASGKLQQFHSLSRTLLT